jgi:hypothetical protein
MSKLKRPHLLDLVTDPATGALSHTRIWSNIGCAAATFVFVKAGLAGKLDADIWAIFLTGVCGHAALSKFLSLKYATKKSEGGE